jgi:hypothetical protein
MATELAPDDVVVTHAQAAGNLREPLLVLEPLRAFLAEAGLDAPDDLSAQPIGDGHSNVTFALSTGVVLRRPPRGPLAPSTHDVLREAQLLRALTPAEVPTPAVLAVCEDRDVIGAPFYVMELIDGVVITADVPAPLDTRTSTPAWPTSSSTAWSPCTRSTATRMDSTGSADPRATWSASSSGFSGCGSTTRRARSPRSPRSHGG